MNAFLQGDIDAAQAMTYNEYAQLLETTNPDTGELYQPEDFNVISYEDTEGAMLQDAIWADTERLAERRGLPGHDGQVPEGRHQGLGLRAPRTRRRRRTSRSPPAPAGVRATSCGWSTRPTSSSGRRPTASASIDEDAWDKTVDGRARGRERVGRAPHHRGAAGDRLDERLDPEGARRARGRRPRPHRRELRAHRRHPRGGRQLAGRMPRGRRVRGRPPRHPPTAPTATHVARERKAPKP